MWAVKYCATFINLRKEVNAIVCRPYAARPEPAEEGLLKTK